MLKLKFESNKAGKMDQPKIQRMLRLMTLLSGNVNYTVDELADKLEMSYRSIYRYIDTFKEAGFTVEKLEGSIYKLVKMPRGYPDFRKLVLFSEEEAFIVNRLIDSIDNTNALKTNLKRKLVSVYDSTSIANFVGQKGNSANVGALGDAIKDKRKVILRNYESASSSGKIRDRYVEPFELTTNYIDVWAYDLEDGRNKIFKLSRIDRVDVLDDIWTAEKEHKRGLTDCFRMSGYNTFHVKLEMGLMSKDLLVEEYPLALQFLSRKGDKWLFETDICSVFGIGRFVLGLKDDINILEGEPLKAHLRDFAKKYLLL